MGGEKRRFCFKSHLAQARERVHVQVCAIARQRNCAKLLSSLLTNPKLVLTHNHNDSDAREGISLGTKSREAAMKNVARYRAMGSLCRQHAAYHPNESWRLLAQAEHWEHLAAVEMSSHFEDCNIASSGDAAKSDATANSIDTRWKTIAAA
jgi:hypothetical protein